MNEHRKLFFGSMRHGIFVQNVLNDQIHKTIPPDPMATSFHCVPAPLKLDVFIRIEMELSVLKKVCVSSLKG